jgi:uroporphyrinogen decarboxylase-like protein
MTERERFLETMRWGHPDRPPLWEEGVQEDTLAAWREQGLPAGAALDELFRFDRRETVEVNLGPLRAFRHDDSAESFARLQACYQADGRQRLPAHWERRVEEWSRRDYPLGMGMSRGLLQSLGIEDWSTLERVLCALCDEPAAVEATMECVLELTLQVLEEVLREVTLDFAIFSEPIASFHALVVSPAHYRRFALSHLRRLVERLHAAEVTSIVMQSYGQVEALVPLWLEAGVNTLWCCHAGPSGIDNARLRRRYGKELRLIGGIPAAALLQGQQAIDEALRKTAAPLLEAGGYLPIVDDRVRSYVPYENYRYYRTQLEKLVGER